MKYASIEILLPADAIADCSGSGDQTSNVVYWASQRIVAKQLEALTLEDTAAILLGYGAWEPEELRDRDTNLARIVWIACCDAAEAEDYEAGTDQYVGLEGHADEAELRLVCVRATCGNCGASWNDAADPAPAALCHTCHGRGYSTAELD